MIDGNLDVKFLTIQTNEAAEVGRVRDEKGRRKKIREEKQKKEDQRREKSAEFSTKKSNAHEKVEKSRDRKVCFQCLVVLGGRPLQSGGLDHPELLRPGTHSRPKFFGGPYSNQHPTLSATTPWPISTMPVLISPITHHIPSPMAFFSAAISWTRCFASSAPFRAGRRRKIA